MSQPDTTLRAQGSATVQGELWGWRADDWAEVQEPRQVGLYSAGLRLAAVGRGTRVLDLACGGGLFCRLAADLGAQVSGIDATPALVEIARRRVPEGDVRVGDMQFLPFPDDSFDALCCFTSIQFAADRVAALRDARRVARPGARLLVVVWGPDERCELSALMRAWAPLLPPQPVARPVPLWAPGALTTLVASAGWSAEPAGELETVWEYPDADALARAVLASAGGCLVVRNAGEELARRSALDALAPLRTEAGSYRIRNEWRYVLAAA